MPIIACPYCGTRLEGPDSVLGRQVVCGQCNGRFVAAGSPAEVPATPPGQQAGSAAAQGAASTPPSPTPPAAPWPYGPYDASSGPMPLPPSMPTPYGAYPKTSGTATAALVLGILSLIPGCCCWPVGLVLAILAIVYAGWTARDVAAGLMDPACEGKAKAGKICGIIGLILAILGVIWMIFSLATQGFHANYNFHF